MPEFTGPVFIVGMPRSGTKLLRELLNSHSRICIPEYETEFYPYLVSICEKYKDLSDFLAFDKFYKEIVSLPYFVYRKKYASVISSADWYQYCVEINQSFSPASIFECLIRHDAECPKDVKNIWGDKSPTYIKHMALLQRHFPDARFVHIVRDVRDYCLSINKAWGKNMLRACQRWTDDVSAARKFAEKFPTQYFQLRYEDLLSKPEEELQGICDFIQINFEETMLVLSKSPEKVGDTSGAKIIVATNKNKYRDQISTTLISEIEKISGPVLYSLGYETDNAESTNRLSKTKLMYYQLMDGVNMGISTYRRRGLRDTVQLMTGAFRATRN